MGRQALLPRFSDKRLLRCWAGINQRCNNSKAKGYKNYGGKGIVNKLTRSELQMLWDRDQAVTLVQPSIDRVDSNGNYELQNCRFIEMNANRINRDHIKVEQDSELKRNWPSIHVRLKADVMELLKKHAREEDRSMSSAATHLLTIALLSKAIGKRMK